MSLIDVLASTTLQDDDDHLTELLSSVIRAADAGGVDLDDHIVSSPTNTADENAIHKSAKPDSLSVSSEAGYLVAQENRLMLRAPFFSLPEAVDSFALQAQK